MPSNAKVRQRQCTFCDLTFPNKPSRREHYRKNHPRCQRCHTRFESTAAFVRHQQLASHCYCQECDVYFNAHYQHFNHVRERFHVTGRICIDCGRAYPDAEALETHCCDCDRIFVSTRSLDSHLRSNSNHTSRPEVPNLKYKCLSCSDTFKKRRQLLSHMRSHHQTVLPCPTPHGYKHEPRSLDVVKREEFEDYSALKPSEYSWLQLQQHTHDKTSSSKTTVIAAPFTPDRDIKCEVKNEYEGDQSVSASEGNLGNNSNPPQDRFQLNIYSSHANIINGTTSCNHYNSSFNCQATTPGNMNSGPLYNTGHHLIPQQQLPQQFPPQPASGVFQHPIQRSYANPQHIPSPQMPSPQMPGPQMPGPQAHPLSANSRGENIPQISSSGQQPARVRENEREDTDSESSIRIRSRVPPPTPASR